MEKLPKKSNNRNRKTRRNTVAIPRYRPLPAVTKIRLTSRQYDTGAAVSSPLWLRLGLLEPLGVSPVYEAVHFQLYRKARIISTYITAKLINMGTEPIEMVVNYMPHNWINGSPAIAELIGKQGAKRAIVSSVGGMDRATLNNFWTSKKVLGHDYALADYDFNFSQAISSTPIDIEEPAIIIALTALNSSTAITYRLEYVIEYDYEFYDQYVV